MIQALKHGDFLLIPIASPAAVGQKVAQSDFLCEECVSGYRFLDELKIEP